MTPSEYRAEHQHIYQTRLGILGVADNRAPTADQNNLAARESDEHIAALKRANRQNAIAPLLELRDSLSVKVLI